MVTDPNKPDRKKIQERGLVEPTIIAGRYRLDNLLGQSSNAKVYRAIDLNNNYPVSLKLFFKKLERDPNFIALFRKEVRAAHKLNHPGIVKTLDYGYDPQGYFLVNTYVDGRNLDTLIKSQGKLDFIPAIGIMIPLCEALHYAHLQGVTHRDLKPQNVLLDNRGKPHLVDFGLARAVANTGLTVTGHMMGSVSYLAPEQVQNDTLTSQTDIYVLGVMLFQMVTGRLPFEGDADLLVALAHVRQAPPSPRQFNPKVPANLEAVIMRCLAKDPSQRFASLPLLKAALQNCLESVTHKSHHSGWVGLTHSGPVSAVKGSSKKGLVIAGLLSGVTLIVLLLVILNITGLVTLVKASTTATPGNSIVPQLTAPATTPAATTGAADPTKDSVVPTTEASSGSQNGATSTPAPTSAAKETPVVSTTAPATNPPEATTPAATTPGATTAEPTVAPTTEVPTTTVPPTASGTDNETSGGTTGKEIHWLNQDGPVHVDRNLVIGPDETLIIDPGVVIKMGSSANITIAGGKLEAKGTAEQPIVFTSALNNPKPGSWGELVITESGEVTLSNVELNYGGSATGWLSDPRHPVVLVADGRLEMTSSKITNGGGPALVVRSKGHGFATDNSFTQNANSEIYNDSKDFTVK